MPPKGPQNDGRDHPFVFCQPGNVRAAAYIHILLTEDVARDSDSLSASARDEESPGEFPASGNKGLSASASRRREPWRVSGCCQKVCVGGAHEPGGAEPVEHREVERPSHDFQETDHRFKVLNRVTNR